MAGEAVQRHGESRGPRNDNQFKRTYKACEACRKTKAKCERDDRVSQSCFKCRREQKECIFPAQRSNKRAKLSDHSSSHSSSQPHSGSAAELGTDYVGPASTSHPSSNPYNDIRIVPHESSTLQLPSESAPGGARSLNQAEASSVTTVPFQDQVVRTVVASSSDAVGLLFRAAEDSDSEGSDSANQRDSDHPTVSSVFSHSLHTREPVSAEVLDLWNQHRFVRQGWFTAREAVAYIEAFFTKMSSLSPVVDSFYADPQNHKWLILEEPLLCCTLLMISSRHFVPPGSGGAVRADYIHARLWKHVEHLVQRITFGSEKYSVAKTRTLGSIQALLLITDWHPRSLHFPPENDGWDASLAPSIDDSFTPQERYPRASKRWREDVFEPAKRSDRLSWMLVGLATTLAHELGVFKAPDEEGSVELTTTRCTKLRIRRLLYLYVTQLSQRLGCTSFFPQEALRDIGHPMSSDGVQLTDPRRDEELILSKWIDITKLLATVGDMFFASRAVTKQMLRGSRYVSLLDHFQSLLDSWHQGYTSMVCPSIPESGRKFLLVDYYFARIYIHSIAIQALVDRISNTACRDEAWQDHGILQAEHAQDFASVNEVRESSGKILTIAVELSNQGILQYCPVRLYLRIVSASVFLLKSMSLGSREADITASLQTLDRCITALNTGRADDIHLSSRYATLMARHVQRFKKNFRVKKKAVAHPSTTPHGSRATSESRLYGFRNHHNQDSVPQQGDGQQSGVGGGGAAADQNQADIMNDFTGDTTSLNEQFGFAEDASMEDWLAQPFNPQMALFGPDHMWPGSGLAVDSLDFLWNIPGES